MSFSNKPEDKSCNCRNSKCMKLYCQCFSAGLQCNNNCRCLDCHNKGNADTLKMYKEYGFNSERRNKDQFGRATKGCACRKSNCTKKYCQCFQAGISCTDLCRCLQCQNNGTLNNRKVIEELKKNNSESSAQPAYLYPIVISRNIEDIGEIISSQNPLHLQQDFLQKAVNVLYQKSSGGEKFILESFMEVLSNMDLKLEKQTKIQKQEQQQISL